MPSYHGEWLAIFLGLLAISVWAPSLFLQNFRLPRIALLPLALVVFLFTQQWLLPEVILQNLPFGLIYLLWTALLITLAHNLLLYFDYKDIVRVLAFALQCGAIFASCRELWWRFMLNIGGDWGGIGQYNRYSAYLCLGLVSSLYLRNRGDLSGLWSLLLLFVAEVLIVAAISISPSRSTWIYIIGLALLTVGCKTPEKRRLLIGLISAAILITVFQLLWKMGWLPTIETEQLSGDRLIQENNNLGLRQKFWLIAWRIFMESPWLGQGFGQSRWAFFQAGAIPACPGCMIEHTHNIIMQFLVELGLFPVLMLCGGLGIWLSSLIKAQKGLESWWLFGLLAIIGWYSMVEYPLWFSYFLGITAVLLGIGEQKYYPLSLNKAVKWGVTLAVPLMLGLCLMHRNDYMQLEDTMYAMRHNNYQQAANKESVAKLRAVGESSPSLIPYVHYCLLLVGTDDPQPNDDMLKTGDLAIHFRPSPKLVYRQTIYLGLAGRSTEASMLMAQGLKTYPCCTKFFFQYVQAYTMPERQKLSFLLDMASHADVYK